MWQTLVSAKTWTGDFINHTREGAQRIEAAKDGGVWVLMDFRSVLPSEGGCVHVGKCARSRLDFLGYLRARWFLLVARWCVGPVQLPVAA